MRGDSPSDDSTPKHRQSRNSTIQMIPFPFTFSFDFAGRLCEHPGPT